MTKPSLITSPRKSQWRMHKGKIYKDEDWKAKAIEHYEKFLSLWIAFRKDADPGIAEVDTLREDARKRLAGLERVHAFLVPTKTPLLLTSAGDLCTEKLCNMSEVQLDQSIKKVICHFSTD